MQRFELARPTTLEQARELLAEKPGAVLRAGGVDLIDHLKEHLLEPERVVDLRGIPGLDRIDIEPDGTLRLGALVTLAQVAAHPQIVRSHPALAQACGEAASPQVRNVATLGGNVLQRPRCAYYRLETFKCLKKGGDICYAVSGDNRYHVIFGGGPVYAPHPSNAAVPLVAYGATFVLAGTQGTRQVPAADFFTLPQIDARRENVLAPGELLTELRVPPAVGWQGSYASVRERAAFDWPLASLAALVRLEAGQVREARIVLGAVAPIPWRASRAEQALVGRALDARGVEAAAQAAVVGALPLADNGYKVSLVQTLVRRSLLAWA